MWKCEEINQNRTINREWKSIRKICPGSKYRHGRLAQLGILAGTHQLIGVRTLCPLHSAVCDLQLSARWIYERRTTRPGRRDVCPGECAHLCVAHLSTPHPLQSSEPSEAHHQVRILEVSPLSLITSVLTSNLLSCLTF